eukprot:TRINITY_DN1478_c0_g1_i1.p1 TRINITY_DN1478_c0_g1~~TRINITY_DN1478_c0_g1_i1.p1  ORF type:complete len:353 (+),score=52.39 TRINITY_DN1478_c0_g1_i1:1437-2495(+)
MQCVECGGGRKNKKKKKRKREIIMNQPQSPNQPYFAAFKSEFSGIQVKYNPFLANRLAFTCAQNFGIVGKGKLIILDLLPDHQMKPVKILEHKDAVFDCSWAEVNQKLILSGCGNGEILLWDVDLEKVVSQLNGHVGEVQTLECSHKNQNLLLSAGIDSNIIVWDFLQGKQLQTLQKSHMKGIYQTTWHPNNQNLFASVGADGMLKIWDLKSEMNQKLVAGIKAHIGDVLSCDFSKYDEIIATASTDKSIKLWDLRKLQIPVHVLQGHRYPVRKIKFSPHQPNILASGSYDMNVNIWNTEEKLKPLLITHKQHTEFVIGIDFNLFQEKQIATAGWDGRVLVWDWDQQQPQIK